MANLTGQWDAAVEIGLPLVNRVVAVMHANQDSRYATFPHSWELYLDDSYRGPADPIPEAQRSGFRARVAVQISTPSVTLPVEDLPVLEVLRSVEGGTQAPPAPAHAPWRFGPDIVADRAGWGHHLPWRYPKVAARVRIRAWVRGESEPSLPEFVDGYLSVTVGLVRVDVPGGGLFVSLDKDQSLAVGFEPAAGTTVSPEERGLIERLARNLLRADFEPLTFELALPPEVKHLSFRVQPSTPAPTLAATFVLADRPAPASTAGVEQGFLPPGADFGIAVGGDYVAGMLRAQLLSGLPPEYSFSAGWGSVHGKARPDWGAATFELEWGRAVLSVPGTGSVTYGPGIFGGANTDNFSFVARVGFGIALVGGVPEPVAMGDPDIDFTGLVAEVGFVTDRARSALKDSRDQALAAGRSRIRQALDVGRVFQGLLRGIVPNPRVWVTSAQIRPGGLVLGGHVDPFALPPAVVRHRERDGMLDALESWIPGGTIDRFVWQRSGRRPLGSGHTEEHRFVTERSGPLVESVFNARCLTIEGTRMDAGAGTPVRASNCVDLVVALPAWRGEAVRPLLPTTAESGGTIRVTGHYDPWATGAGAGGTCMLVHFAQGSWPEAAGEIEEALAARKREGALVVLAVVPPGGGDEGETAIGEVPVIVTADDTGAWSRAFDAGAPATVLVDPRGEVVWRSREGGGAAAVAKAIDKHSVEGSAVSRIPLRPVVAARTRPADVRLGLDGGGELSLRRLRGQRVLLVFWSSRSPASVDHLRSLARAIRGERTPGALVVAVGDGEDQTAVRALTEEQDLGFPVIPDPHRVVSSRYGIWSWPTSVLVGPDQRVDAIELGGLAPAGRPGKSGPAGD